MKVIAIQTGFYQGSRRRPGAIFEMLEKDMKVVNGKPTLPKWAKEVTDEAKMKQEVIDAKAARERKDREGAIAASGGKAAKTKVEQGQDLA